MNRTSTRDIRQVFLRLSGFAFGLIALGLIACSTPSLKLAPSPDCGSMDWFEIGRIDGSQGEPLLTFNRHIELCAGSTTPPSRDHYVAGREAGLTEFCTPTSGLEAGKLGESYSNVCPSHLERTFLSAFAIGTKIRALENENREVETRIAALIDQLARAKAGNTELETRLDELRRRRAQIESRISEIESTFFTSP